MSDSELSNAVYNQDDEVRYEEIVAQIHWQKAHTRRKSILGAAEIFRVLKTKKHEYDCFGKSLINFLYGVEIVRIMKKLNVSYVEDTDEVFKDKLKNELTYASRKRYELIETLNERKANLINREPKELRAECLEDVKSSEDLIRTRYSSFFTYFKMTMELHREIAAIVEVSEELKVIKSRISTVMLGLTEKRKMVSFINFESMVDFITDDIDHAIEVLNCQADSLADNILTNIEETNNLINLFNRGLGKGGSEGEGEGEGVGGSEGEGSEDGAGIRGREEIGGSEGSEEEGSAKVGDDGFADSEYGTEDDTGEGDLGYLMAAVGKPLIQSLTNCALRHPANPICFVSGFIRNYRIKEVQGERKNEELKLLLAERERIQLIKKAREQEEELRKRMEEALRLSMQPEGEE